MIGSSDESAHIDPKRMRVREFLANWLASMRDEVSPTTHARYKEIADLYLVPQLGDVLLKQLSKLHITEAYRAIADGGRRDGKPGSLAPRTRRHIHRACSAPLLAPSTTS